MKKLILRIAFFAVTLISALFASLLFFIEMRHILANDGALSGTPADTDLAFVARAFFFAIVIASHIYLFIKDIRKKEVVFAEFLAFGAVVLSSSLLFVHTEWFLALPFFALLLADLVLVYFKEPHKWLESEKSEA